ncbi:LysR family transcriptional regulator [Frigidibacter sp. ROC022]|uniref:LysR family transcriptional regulator n=1 Tax=Frigidibacter sp. ROC022 TaxID=2971796 RepID=UPI00215B69FF|nr:LysR family transcriptional regulator [Frigidibacter sp. ROC022]
MNFKQIEAFYWLTQLQSYQRVADHLHLTQPAVSSRISGLEAQVGGPLVDRSSPGFVLTERGHQVAGFAEMFVNLREAMVARLEEPRERRYAIGMVGNVALTWGVTLREKIAAWDPDLIVDVISGSNVDLQRRLNSGVLDMVFGTDDVSLPHIPHSFSVKYTVGWAVRPELVGDISRPWTPEELRSLPLILYPRSSPFFPRVAELLDETQTLTGARCIGNSASMICDMVRCGYGAAALALSGLERELQEGSVVEIPTTAPLAPLDIRCAHLNRARKAQTEAIYAFAREAAEQWCAEHPAYMRFDEE